MTSKVGRNCATSAATVMHRNAVRLPATTRSRPVSGPAQRMHMSGRRHQACAMRVRHFLRGADAPTAHVRRRRCAAGAPERVAATDCCRRSVNKTMSTRPPAARTRWINMPVAMVSSSGCGAITSSRGLRGEMAASESCAGHQRQRASRLEHQQIVAQRAAQAFPRVIGGGVPAIQALPVQSAVQQAAAPPDSPCLALVRRRLRGKPQPLRRFALPASV